MRQSPLHDRLVSSGAAFTGRYGAEIATAFSDPAAEYRHVRDNAGLADFSFKQKFRVPEETGLDFLDSLMAGNVARVRFGRMLHTFLADNDGNLAADCYVANNDDEFIVLCESIIDDDTFWKIMNEHGARDAGVEDLSGSHVLLSLDGYKAWGVVRELFGADVLGLPYLSIETYPFEGEDVRLFRAGKTSEFGYLLLAPAGVAGKLFDVLHESVAKQGGGLCGLSIHDALRLEGRFFNIFAEGAAVRDPLALGLQWMIDFDKESFLGHDAILKRREEGLVRKIIGVKTAGKSDILKPGATIFDDGGRIADVVASCFSQVLDCSIGLALFPAGTAYAGLQFALGSSKGEIIRTISMPPIMPKSLTVKLDEV